MNCRALSLDIGGTLITPWPSVGHIYAGTAAAHGVRGLDPEELTRRFKAAWRAHPAFNHTRQAWAAVVDTTFDGLCPAPPSATFFDELWDRFAQANAWRVFEDVVPSLEECQRRGLKLGVISNWDDRLHPLLERLGLRPYFQAVIVSCDIGAAKPAPLIFARAAAALGLPPAEILHVGDEPEADLAGATAAGFAARLLNRRGPPGPGHLTTLADLVT